MMQPSSAREECNWAERVVEVGHAEGLHMRPAMQFVDCANGFESKIQVFKGEMCVDGKSIMQMSMLAATKGTKLKISANGKDAQQAIESLAELIENESPNNVD